MTDDENRPPHDPMRDAQRVVPKEAVESGFAERGAERSEPGIPPPAASVFIPPPVPSETKVEIECALCGYRYETHTVSSGGVAVIRLPARFECPHCQGDPAKRSERPPLSIVGTVISLDAARKRLRTEK